MLKNEIVAGDFEFNYINALCHFLMNSENKLYLVEEILLEELSFVKKNPIILNLFKSGQHQLLQIAATYCSKAVVEMLLEFCVEHDAIFSVISAPRNEKLPNGGFDIIGSFLMNANVDKVQVLFQYIRKLAPQVVRYALLLDNHGALKDAMESKIDRSEKVKLLYAVYKEFSIPFLSTYVKNVVLEEQPETNNVISSKNFDLLLAKKHSDFSEAIIVGVDFTRFSTKRLSKLKFDKTKFLHCKFNMQQEEFFSERVNKNKSILFSKTSAVDNYRRPLRMKQVNVEKDSSYARPAP